MSLRPWTAVLLFGFVGCSGPAEPAPQTGPTTKALAEQQPQEPPKRGDPPATPPQPVRKKPVVQKPVSAPLPQINAEASRGWQAQGFAPVWFEAAPLTARPSYPRSMALNKPLPGFEFKGRLDESFQKLLPKLPPLDQPFGLRPARKVTAEDLKALAAVKNLTHLSLVGEEVPEAGFKHLAQSETLTSLDLYHTAITDSTLKELAALPHLTTLNLSGTRITDDGLKELAALKNLTTLYLGGTQISDRGLKELAAFKNLTTLYLLATRITDAGLKELTPLKKLRTLDLSYTPVTDAGLKELAPHNLTYLDLSSTKVTDACAPALARHTTLTSLRLSCVWSEAALTKLAPLTELKALYLDSAAQDGLALAGLSVLPKLDTLELVAITDDVLAALRKAGKLHTLPRAMGERGRPAGPDEVILLDLFNTPVTGKGLKELAVLKNLDTLLLQQTQVADGMKSLTELKNLTTLSMSFKGLRRVPSDLKELAALDSLDTLDLTDCGNLGPDSARAVAAIPNLATLTVGMTDAGARELPALKHLRTLRIGGITDDGLKEVAKIKTLTAVSTRGNRITDEGVKALPALTALAHLDLSATGVGDGGAKALATMTALKTLRLRSTNVNAPGVVALANLKLVALDLSDTKQLWPLDPKEAGAKLESPGVEALATMKSLEYLDLSGVLVLESSVKGLASLPKLRALDLRRSPTPANAFPALAGSKSLTWLRLALVRQEDVAELTAFKNLTQFHMVGTRLGDADKEKLHRALPRCEVTFDGGPLHMPWPETPLEEPSP